MQGTFSHSHKRLSLPTVAEGQGLYLVEEETQTNRQSSLLNQAHYPLNNYPLQGISFI